MSSVVAKQQPGRVNEKFSQPSANSRVSGMVLETKSNAPKQASSSDSTNGAKSAMQSMSINKAMASTSASAAAAADFEDISCKERFKCTGQEIFNALTQREMIQVATKDDEYWLPLLFVCEMGPGRRCHSYFQVFTSAPVVMSEAKAGERFEMLGGNIQGEFVEVRTKIN